MNQKDRSLEGPRKRVNAEWGDLVEITKRLAGEAGGDAGDDLAGWTRKETKADHVLILLRRPGEEFKAAARTDLSPEVRKAIYAYARRLAGWVVRTREALTVDDARNDPRFPDPPADVSAVRAVPLRGLSDSEGAVVAVFNGEPGTAVSSSALRMTAALFSLVADRKAMFDRTRDLVNSRESQEKELLSARREGARGRMVVDIAEELKHPLAGVGAAVRRLREALDAEDERLHLVDILSQEIERLNQLIVEQIELGNSADPQLQAEDVNRLLRECVELSTERLKKQKVRVTQRMGASMPHLLLDPELMRRVFLNLLRTAIHHASPGGRVKVQSKRRGNVIEVLFTADGARDPGQSLENLWRPFAGEGSADSVSSEAVQRILRDHRGILRVSSTYDWPLVFSLTLPIPDNLDRRLGARDRRVGEERRRA